MCGAKRRTVHWCSECCTTQCGATKVFSAYERSSPLNFVGSCCGFAATCFKLTAFKLTDDLRVSFKDTPLGQAQRRLFSLKAARCGEAAPAFRLKSVFWLVNCAASPHSELVWFRRTIIILFELLWFT
jgi:hypothetical protein